MISSELYQRYLQALLAGKRAECAAVVSELLHNEVPVRILYDALFKKSMYTVGELWETNTITVATEHLATAITESLLNLVYPLVFAVDSIGKKMVIGCCTGEYHQIGAKMVADLFALKGWDSHFLGANVPLDDMLAFIRETRPDLVALSVSILSNVGTLTRALDALQDSVGELPVMVGGRAFLDGGAKVLDRYPEVQYFATTEDLEKWLQGEF